VLQSVTLQRVAACCSEKQELTVHGTKKETY